MCGDVHVHSCGSQRLTSGDSTNRTPSYFLSQSLSLNLELTDLFRLSGHQSPGIPPALAGQHEDHRHMPSCLFDADGDLHLAVCRLGNYSTK